MITEESLRKIVSDLNSRFCDEEFFRLLKDEDEELYMLIYSIEFVCEESEWMSANHAFWYLKGYLRGTTFGYMLGEYDEQSKRSEDHD